MVLESLSSKADRGLHPIAQTVKSIARRNG
jgi:hypothetical protein